MLINNYNFQLYNSNLPENNKKNSNLTLKPQLSRDTFNYSSNPSFKRNATFDYKTKYTPDRSKSGTVDWNYVITLLEGLGRESYYSKNKTITENDKLYFSESLKNISDKSQAEQSDYIFMTTMLYHYMQRIHVVIYPAKIEQFNETHFNPNERAYFKNLFMENRLNNNMPIGEYNKKVKLLQNTNSVDKMTELLTQNGIYNTNQIADLVANLDENKAFLSFETQGVDSLNIYSKLNNKDNLGKFIQLLLYNYNKTENKSEFNPEENKLDFLTKTLNITNLKDFENKYSHLKEYFNEFKTMSDKNEAIDYVYSTYEDKINLIESAIEKSQIKDNQFQFDDYSQLDFYQNNPLTLEEKAAQNIIKSYNGTGFTTSPYLIQKSINHLSAENIYRNNKEIIDILYENNQNNPENTISTLNNILGQITNPSEIKNLKCPVLRDGFNGLQTINDKIELLEFLSEYHTSVEALNTISDKIPVISDNNIFESLQNKNDIVGFLGNSELIEERYKNFPDLYNTIYNNGNFKPKNFETLSKIIENFQIKKNKDMLDLYNKINHKKEKAIKSEDFKNFIELMDFCDFSALKQKNKIKIPTIKDLDVERQKFLQLEPKITKFINSDNNTIFIGKSAMDIYFENKDLLLENPDETEEILGNIQSHNKKDDIQNMFQFKKAFFEDRPFSDFNNFAIKNNIKFDSRTNDDRFISNCGSILSTIKDEEKTFDYIINSEFLGNSRKLLNNFNIMHDRETIKDFMSVIADKKVPSLQALKKYKDTDGNYDNVIISLKNTPDDMTFEEFDKIISNANSVLKRHNLTTVKINNDNIADIDIETIKNSKTTPPQIISGILTPDFEKTKENFITKLPKAMNNYKQTELEDIVEELATTTFRDLENRRPLSYKNILSKLDINNFDKNIYKYNNQVKEKMENEYKNEIRKKLKEEKEFTKFVKDADFLEFNGNIPNLSHHAMLRLIERFAFKNNSTELYSLQTKENLKGVIKSIYGEIPAKVESEELNRFSVLNTKAKAVFSNDGKMVTVY